MTIAWCVVLQENTVFSRIIGFFTLRGAVENDMMDIEVKLFHPDMEVIMDKNEIAIVTESEIRDRIYVIRGQRVMLETDLAEIYGYDHKGFNKQVSNNADRFDDDFRFLLTWDEVADLRRKNYAANISPKRRTPPFVYNEQGIYMLMTVLKGELAIKQSKALVRLFKQMKDILITDTGLIGQKELLQLSVQTAANAHEIQEIKETMATKDDLTKFMAGFVDEHIGREFLLMNGQMVEADAAYSKIFGLAKKSIYLIDNFVGIKTLALLKNTAKGVKIIIFTDNHQRTLHLTEYQDFCKEYPQMRISFQRTMDKFHDRYIILDYKLRSEKMYNCGSSPKDSGRTVTSITKSSLKMAYHPMVDTLLNNPPYVLK